MSSLMPEKLLQKTFLLSLCNERNHLLLLDFKIMLFCQSSTPIPSSTGWTVAENCVKEVMHVRLPAGFPPSFPGTAVKPFPTTVVSRV